MPSESLRSLEIQANGAFDTYRELYFEGGVSSVYLWDLEAGFAGVVLIKKGMFVCGPRMIACLPADTGPSHANPHSRRRQQEDQGLLGLDPRV